MGQIQNIEDLLNFLYRRRWLIALVVVVGTLLSALYAKTRPDTFEASAAIQVQGAQVGAATTDSGAAPVLQSIEQRLTTRDSLLAMIRRHGLYQDMPALSDDQKVALLRASIWFQAIEAASSATYGQSAQVSAIIITASYGEAEKAARIANDVAQGILDMSSSGQIERARDTYAFYQEEQDRLAIQVAALEAGIADYKTAHPDALPAAAEARRDELVGIESDIRALDQNLVALMEEQRQLSSRGDLRATERRRLQELDGQIAVLTEQKSALNARSEALRSALAGQPDVERDLSGMERDLAQLQAGLAAATGRLAEADTALRLAERQQGERFALLDRAVTPEYPVGSSGKKLFVAGAMASLFLGLGLAFLLDLLRPVIRTSAQMERQLGLRPVMVIPEIDFSGLPRRKPAAEAARALRDKALSAALAAPLPVQLAGLGGLVLLVGMALA